VHLKRVFQVSETLEFKANPKVDQIIDTIKGILKKLTLSTYSFDAFIYATVRFDAFIYAPYTAKFQPILF